MRKFLLCATMMVPFAAFAGGSGLSVAGDVNLAKSPGARRGAGTSSDAGRGVRADAARDTEAGVVQPSRAVD